MPHQTDWNVRIMHKLIIVAFAGAVLTAFYTSAARAADERDGPYVRGDAGISFQEMESFDVSIR